MSDELRYLRGIVRSLTKNKARAHRERWMEALPESVAVALSGAAGRSMSSPPVPLRRRAPVGAKKRRVTGKRRVRRATHELAADIDNFGFLQVWAVLMRVRHRVSPAERGGVPVEECWVLLDGWCPSASCLGTTPWLDHDNHDGLGKKFSRHR